MTADELAKMDPLPMQLVSLLRMAETTNLSWDKCKDLNEIIKYCKVLMGKAADMIADYERANTVRELNMRLVTGNDNRRVKKVAR